MPDFDAYKTLQVDPEADIEVIQAAYRRLARKYHPDLVGNAASAERMTSLNAAWELLRDPSRRAAYDAQRASPSSDAPDRGLPWRPSSAHGEWAAGSPRSDAPNGETDRGSGGSAGPAGPARGPGGEPGSGPDRDRSAGRPAGGTSVRPEQPRAGGRGGGSPAGDTGQRRAPEGVPRDWTSGRSSLGSGYDPSTMRAADGFGAAGPPPGGASGSVLNFGRYAGWSVGEIARRDIEYLEWLDRVPIGRQYRDEIDKLLRQRGLRRTADAQEGRRGLFRRR